MSRRHEESNVTDPGIAKVENKRGEIKKTIEKIKERTDGGLRGMCGRINPDRRVIVIVVLFVLFALINLYVTFRGIYSIGRDHTPDVTIELPSAGETDEAGNEEKSELQLEIEQFFDENFNNGDDDS